MKFRAKSTACAGLLLALAANGTPALADPVSLAPMHAGQYQDGTGIDARFLKVFDDWRDSGVLYDPETDQLGVGQPIGNFPGGSGLWGLVDWNTAYHDPTDGMVEASWAGRVSQIAFGDSTYNGVHGDLWGQAPVAPLFAPGGDASEDNWAARFQGYIRIAEAGVYNFGVLHDDGFFFDLRGANGQQVSISNDFLNPPNRMSFANGLLLDVGLYAFELGAYEHLEAGIVELSWMRGDGDWSRVPTGHLVAGGDVTPVPEPGTWAMALAGLAALGSLTVRRRRAQS